MMIHRTEEFRFLHRLFVELHIPALIRSNADKLQTTAFGA